MHTVDEQAKKLLEDNGFKFNFMDGWFQIVGRNSPKPHTKTKYVKCEFSDTMGMIDGDICIDSDLYFEWSSKHVVPISEVSARDLIMNRHKLVRKAEKEIDWREEVNDYMHGRGDGNGCKYTGKMNFDVDGLNFYGVVSTREFIKMCRLVESLTRHIDI